MLSREGVVRSFNALQGHLFEVLDDMLHPNLRLRVSHQGFQAILLAPDPPHDRSCHNEAFLVRQVDGHGTRLPDSQRHIAGET